MASNTRRSGRQRYLNPHNADLVLYYQGRMAELRNDWNEAKAVFASLSSSPTTEKILKQRSISRLGNALWMLDELAEAESMYMQVLEMECSPTDTVDVANILCNLAKLYQKVGRSEEARQYAERGLSIFEQNGDQVGVVSALQILVQGDWLECRFAEAEQLQDRLILQLKKMGSTAGLADAYSKLADIYRFEGKLEDALSAYFESLGLYESCGERFLIGWVQAGIGEIYRMRGNLTDAFENTNRSLEVFNRIDYRVGIAWGKHSLGEIYRHEGKYRLAMQLFEDCLAMFEEGQDVVGAGTTLCGIGEIYLAQNDLVQAQSFFEKGISLLRQMNDHYGASRALRGMGVLLREKEHYDMATEYITQTMENFTKMTNPYQVGICYYYLGTVCVNRGDLVIAKEYMETALQLVAAQNDEYHTRMIKESLRRLHA